MRRFVLLCLLSTTLFAQDLSDAERAAAIKALWEAHPAYGSLPVWTGEVPSDGEMRLFRLSLTAPDGGRMPDDSTVRFIEGDHISSRARDPERTDDVFTVTSSSRQVRCYAVGMGIPLQEIPLPDPASIEGPIEVAYQLQGGRDYTISIVDEEGAPITQARMDVQPVTPSMFHLGDRETLQSDEQGRVTVRLVEGARISCSIRAPGQAAIHSQILTQGSDDFGTVVMNDGREAIVHMKDSEGQPSAGQKVWLVSTEWGHGSWASYLDTEVDPWAVSDDQGMVVLDGLDGHGLHGFSAISDRAWARFYVVAGGEQTVAIKPLHRLQGIVEGDVEALPTTSDGAPILRYSYTVGLNVARGDYVVLQKGEWAWTFHSDPIPADQVRFEHVTVADSGGLDRVDVSGARLVLRVNDDIQVGPEAIAPSMQTIRLVPGVGDQMPEHVRLLLNLDYGRGDAEAHGSSVKKALFTRSFLQSTDQPFRVPLPARIIINNQYGEAWWFPPVHWSPATSTGEVHARSLHARPAGAVHGTCDPDQITSIEFCRFAAMDDVLGDAFWQGKCLIDEETGTFMSDPLPIGYRFVPVIRGPGAQYIVADPVTITAAAPAQEITIPEVEGRLLRGRVVDDEGQPLAAVRIQISMHLTDPEKNIYFDRTRTDVDGRFQFENVNPDIPGHYEISADVFGRTERDGPFLNAPPLRVDFSSDEVQIEMTEP